MVTITFEEYQELMAPPKLLMKNIDMKRQYDVYRLLTVLRKRFPSYRDDELLTYALCYCDELPNMEGFDKE